MVANRRPSHSRPEGRSHRGWGGRSDPLVARSKLSHSRSEGRFHLGEPGSGRHGGLEWFDDDERIDLLAMLQVV